MWAVTITGFWPELRLINRLSRPSWREHPSTKPSELRLIQPQRWKRWLLRTTTLLQISTGISSDTSTWKADDPIASSAIFGADRTDLRRSAIFAGGSGARFCIPDFVKSSTDRKSTRLNSSHHSISYAVFCLKKKNTK